MKNQVKYHLSQRAQASADLCDLVAHLSVLFPVRGTVIHGGRNCLKRMSVTGLEAHGIRQVIVKQHHRPNIFQRIDYSYIRHSKARRAYEHGTEMLERGINTPEPLAYVEEWQDGIYQRGYYVYADCDDTLLKDEMEHDQQLVMAFARFIAQMHEQGIVHGDLNPTNVLYRADDMPGQYHFMLLDINRSRVFNQPVPLRRCRKDLFTFWAAPASYELFIRQYLSARNIIGEKAVDDLLREKRRNDRRRHVLKRTLKLFKKWYYRIIERF